jgi:type VI secretion system secreted protein VgrG
MFEDKKDKELVRMHAQKNHDVTVRDSETWTIGEACKGGASRTTTLENGDDSLKIYNGSRNVEISRGGQSVQALFPIETVSRSQVSHSVISGSVSSLTIDARDIKLKTPAFVKIDAPVVMITGNLWVMGDIRRGPMGTPV